MAAARLNIPTIIVACGYQASGSYRGRHCDIEDVFLAAGHVANGRLSVDELTEMSGSAVLSPGVCAGIGTANTMHLACEALGMALPAPRRSGRTASRCGGRSTRRRRASWRWWRKT